MQGYAASICYNRGQENQVLSNPRVASVGDVKMNIEARRHDFRRSLEHLAKVANEATRDPAIGLASASASLSALQPCSIISIWRKNETPRG